MLVLSRHIHESIWIGPGQIPPEGIWVTVVDIRSDKCRLGVTAPVGIEVHRQEVYEAILRDRRRENGGVA